MMLFSHLRLVFVTYICLGYFVLDINSFFLDQTQSYDCGGIVKAGKGKIETPNFPDLYPPGADCVWEIRADVGSKVSLQTVWFSVEDQTDCLWDHVIIQDGVNGEFGRQVHCGYEGFRFLSTSNVVKVIFKSDASGSDPGFQIQFEEISDGGSTKTCNKTMTQEGVMTTPNYPSPYPSDVICYFVIQAPDQHIIQLSFTDFEVESSPCDFDRLEVLKEDTNGHHATVSHSFCGRTIPSVYNSLVNKMTLRFVSDDSMMTRGFSADVRFVPVTATETTSPTTTSTTSTTTTTTTTSTTTTTTTPTTTTTTTTSTTTPMPSTMSITDESTTNRFPVIGVCNQTITAPISNISSPGYPAPYPLKTTCVTKLRSDVISTFVIKFLNFSMEEGEKCSYDSLTIYAGNHDDAYNKKKPNMLRRMCGALPDNVIVTWEGHWLDLAFHSDQSVNMAGYYANVVVTPVVQAPKCPDVCKNGGTCAETLLPDGSIDWVCLCTEDYTGVFCDILSPESCRSITCHNGGSCRRQRPSAVCVCPNGFKGIYCEQSLTLTDGGSLYFTKMSGNMTLSIGTTAILECSVNDVKANVMWLFHDTILTNSDWSRGVEVHPGGVIVIPEAKDELSGRYTCMAVTPDDLIERSVWINLMEPCTLEVAKGPDNMTVREGEAALFQCYVPEADVTLWRKDGDLVKQGPRKRFLVNHYLVINPVVETDAGQYTCAARGINGCFSETSAYLKVETTGHRKECGRPRNPTTDDAVVGRISSGREAPYGSAPWHVIIREWRTNSTVCGGSLISRDTVLTAAHCVTHFEDSYGYVFHPRYIQLYVGTNHCDGHNGIKRNLKWYRLHERFNNTYFNNDVAIFKMDMPVTYSDDVMPICLEKEDFVEELMRPGKLGVITGCGHRDTHTFTRMPPKHLHEVQIPIVARDVCLERADAVNTRFTDGMFCAGYALSMRGDACSGDSGGAYTVRFHDRSILVGIVSWGVGCDKENHYGYYTHVARYYDWINNNMDIA